MFKLLLAIVSITSIVLLKFDFYFRDFIFNDNRVLTGLMVGIGTFLFMKLNGFIWGVFSETNGPLGKFIHASILVAAGVLIVALPFENMHEFWTMFGIACAVMTIPMYFLFKKMYQIHKENYSFIDIMNNKLRMISESSLFTAFLGSLTLLYVDSKDGHINMVVDIICAYFLMVLSVSLLSRFNLSRNFFVNAASFYMAVFFILFGSYEQYKYTDLFIISGGVWLFIITLYDVVILFTYLKNPAKFLKGVQVAEWAKSILSVRADSTIDYFKYFKNVKVAKTFIHYNSILGRVDCICNGDYSIIKNTTPTLNSEDRLFHIDDKAVQVRVYTEFFDLSKKRLDEQTDLDRYAFFKVRKIKAYLNAANMTYDELTEADIQVLEMFSY